MVLSCLRSSLAYLLVGEQGKHGLMLGLFFVDAGQHVFFATATSWASLVTFRLS